jgi:hypothetical protein
MKTKKRKLSRDDDPFDLNYKEAKKKFPKMKLSYEEFEKRRPVVPFWHSESVFREAEEKNHLVGVLIRMSEKLGWPVRDTAKHETIWDSTKYDPSQFTENIIELALKAYFQLDERLYQYIKQVQPNAICIGFGHDFDHVKKPADYDKELEEEEGPKRKLKVNRCQLFGMNISSVIRRMGKEGFDFETTKRALSSHGIVVKDSTIKGQLWCGKSGKYGDVAELSEKQIDNLFIAGAK